MQGRETTPLSALLDFLRLVVGWALMVAFGVLFTMLSLAQFANDSPAAGWFWAFLAAVSLLAGAFRAYYRERRRREAAESKEPLASELSFGKAVIPTHSQPLILGSLQRGRVIRVPVTNAQGAGEAKRVHARLRFAPDDVHRQFAPRHDAQGEWAGQHGPELEIDMPGNGRPHYLDVLAVLDGDYPHCYEWTTHSRAANLHGYAIKSNKFDIEIEVLGSAPAAPRVTFKQQPSFPSLRNRISRRAQRLVGSDRSRGDLDWPMFGDLAGLEPTAGDFR